MNAGTKVHLAEFQARIESVALAAAVEIEPTCTARYSAQRKLYIGFSRDFWTQATRQASANCRPGRCDTTMAFLFQEQADKALRSAVKIAIKRALDQVGLPRPKTINMSNRLHHDKLCMVAPGIVTLNR
jgi:hypothetical protein